MTDVPGHTLGIVPLLAEAGVRFLHLGVNTASPPPEVPDLFRWRAPGGEEVVVMYQRSYGETHFPDGFDDGLELRPHQRQYRAAERAADGRGLSRHAPASTRMPRSAPRRSRTTRALLWARRDELPVVDVELGDSWIHGTASDPREARAVPRAAAALRRASQPKASTPARRAFGRGLTLVAEHTWGVDIKSYLRDETAWDRADFEAARTTDYRFAYAEASWAEQRAYLDAAVAALAPADRDRAAGRWPRPMPPPAAGRRRGRDRASTSTAGGSRSRPRPAMSARSPPPRARALRARRQPHRLPP